MSYDPANFEERLLIVADAFAELIAADVWIARAPAIPVATERKGDINAAVADALNKLGLSVVVIMPDGDGVGGKGTALVLRVRLVAQIDELAVTNRARAQTAGTPYRPALSAAARVMKAVNKKPNGLDPAGGPHRSGVNEFTLPDTQPFRLVRDPRCVTYHVTAYTTVEL